jgi:hypothetical protein
MKTKTYPFTTQGLNDCMADIRAEKSRRTINRNTTIAFAVLFVALAAMSGGSSIAFTHTVYELIPAVPMPMTP